MNRLSDRIIRHTLDNLDTKSVALEVLSLEEKIEELEQRGIRMQIMYKYIKSINSAVFGLKYPEEFDKYFDKDGVPLP